MVRVGQRVALCLEAKVHADIDRLVLGYMLRDKQGHVVWGTNTWHTGQVQEALVTGDRVLFTLEFTCTLGPGSYSISPALVSTETHLSDNFEWIDNLLVFDVLNMDYPFFIGSGLLDASFDVSRVRGGIDSGG